MPDFDLLAICAFGLEAVTARELTNLGYEPNILDSGRIHFRGDSRAICRTNLWLRTADRILLRLGTFPATDFGQLFDGVKSLPWEAWMPADAGIHVSGRSLKSQLSSVPACQRIAEKAVVERLRSAHGVEVLPESGAEFRIEVALHKDQAILTLDTTGASLHKRGYRDLVGEAPLKETLAAALVLLSFWRPERPFWDPFCGSGTIPIEAAMIGRNMAPGINRLFFAAEEWPTLSTDLWKEARTEAKDLLKPALPVRIMGTDISEAAMKLARRHSHRAGVEPDIHFQQMAFEDISSSKDYGCLIANPPYAERLGERDEVEFLYRSMPLVLRRLKTWSHFIFTAYPLFEKLVGQPADRRRKLYNGRIECTYYSFFGPKPQEKEGKRRDHEGEEATPEPIEEIARSVGDEELASPSPSEVASVPAAPSQATTSFASPAKSETISNASLEEPEIFSSLGDEDWDDEDFADEESDASRGDAPLNEEAPRERRPERQPARRQAFGGLAPKAHEQAEIFANRLTKRARHLRRWPTKQGITCYRLYERDIPEIPLVVDRYEDCLHIAEFERPHERSAAEHADWLDLMKRTAGEALGVAKENIYLKHRRRQKGDNQYERVSTEGRVITAHEGGLNFKVNLSDFLDTGLFLDHRQTRAMFRAEAAGKRVLNLFAYTGAFSVYAAAGGAASTTTVDLSQHYLDWAVDNMRLNGFAGNTHLFFRDDTLRFLGSQPLSTQYDLAIVDPPTFSNSKRLDDYWDVQRDHGILLNLLAERMTPGGVVYFSNNFRRFKFDPAALPLFEAREISRQTVPSDFRNQRIHRCWRMVRK